MEKTRELVLLHLQFRRTRTTNNPMCLQLEIPWRFRRMKATKFHLSHNEQPNATGSLKRRISQSTRSPFLFQMYSNFVHGLSIKTSIYSSSQSQRLSLRLAVLFIYTKLSCQREIRFHRGSGIPQMQRYNGWLSSHMSPLSAFRNLQTRSSMLCDGAWV